MTPTNYPEKLPQTFPFPAEGSMRTKLAMVDAFRLQAVVSSFFHLLGVLGLDTVYSNELLRAWTWMRISEMPAVTRRMTPACRIV